MHGKRLRIRDIAEETGISEQTVRSYIQQFGDLLPSHAVGRVNLYGEPAVRLIRKIDALASEGSSPEEIARTLHRGGAPRSRAGAQARAPGTPTPQQGAPHPLVPPAPSPPPPPGNHLRSLRDTIALQEQQIKAIHRRLDEMEQANEQSGREIEALRTHLDGVQATHARQVEIIEQWMAYYEQRLDGYEASAQAGMEKMRQWVDYLEEGLERANEPLTTKILRRLW
ncbi:MAG: MerR family transcriptional regulator [Methanomicrobiaceae archaeon]|nr:MerR family transcriptional regulator [Methanomicrobiaceae archaeon]